MKKAQLYPLLLLVAVLMLKKDSPRGIRNNNAGNLRDNNQDWLGETGADEDGFLIFESPVYGLRAMAKLIKNYGALYGVNTVAGIVTRYAPPSENNTKAYIDHVAASVGVSPNAPLMREHYLPLIKAMVLHENGVQPYDDDTILKGIELAWA